MTGLEHSIIATALLAIFFYVGRAIGKRENIEYVVQQTLEHLEDGGFIKTKTDENGEKELVKVE